MLEDSCLSHGSQEARRNPDNKRPEPISALLDRGREEAGES
ncbi:hypothetical protein T4B_4499 [Trichinella pseudospiralis]|uniref:Uncharacterized protein n=1 Tax=Trichinella pseudospiralis TaxID=6337 RepID=A0A0V1GCU5_TRIPS|nr:hypothetical protein T4B_4499 [Trichinella pseudospiralis]